MAKDFRRGLRGDVCSLADGELIVQLFMEEIEVPLQPLAVRGDQGVLMFPNEDDVRLDLARLSRERTNMELDGFVLASAVMSIAKALGYNINELRAACAHELSTCGTPLLRRSPTAENHAERQAAEETLAYMLHESPEPLPPAPAIWARQHQEETGAHLKARKDSTETHSPKTPEATPAKGRRPRSAGAMAKACAGTASSPAPNPPDAREGESSSSRGTASTRRKAGPSASVGDGRSARPDKRRKVTNLPVQEEQADAPPPETEPESSDDNPNEALPRVNAAADDDAEETNEARSDSAPITREEIDAMRKTQKDTAAMLARLETVLLASLANHDAKKRKRDMREEGARGQRMQRRAIAFQRPKNAIRFWETRKGRLSNSAGVNAQIVDGLRECALTDVMVAVDQFQPAYDATTSSWAWGRHGLRLSACGIERQATAAPADSVSGREGDNLSLN
ncbi:unnamed protein product [Closterium sp. Naga37s-1]|nr:unnamed protein product [Closterium sp. Naga37s-1]